MKTKKIIFLLFILFGLGFIASKTYVNAASSNTASEVPGVEPHGGPIGDLAEKDTYYFYMDVAEDIAIEEFQNKITLEAFDDYDGNVTSSITFEDLDDYVGKVSTPRYSERTLGDYRIKYSAEDKSHNVKSLTIIVVVEDTRPPVLEESSTISYEQDIDNITLTNQDILDEIRASDLYDQKLTKTIETGSIEKLDHTKDIEQTITVKVTDASGNSFTQDVTIILRDRKAPTISTTSESVTVSYISSSSVETIVKGLNVVIEDNYDSGLTYTLKNDTYTINKRKIGTYSVDIESVDTSNNKQTKTITINVDDKIPPVFYLDVSKVFVDKQVKLTNVDFLSMLEVNGKIKNDDYEFFVLEDTYSDSSTEEGMYLYRCRVSYNEDDYDDFKFMVNVVSNENKAPSLTFFQSFALTIKKIGDLIWNILKWPISKMHKFI